jgi:hypothetical protein
MGIGSPIGTGKQYMPWIHINDICSIYEFALKNSELDGAFNANSPQHTTNENLTKNGGSSSQTFIYAQCSCFCFETDVRRTVGSFTEVRELHRKNSEGWFSV